MVGVTGISMTIQVAFVFMKAEKEADYVWALTILQEALGEDSLSKVILTDCELALINAIYELVPTTSFFFYRWHINKNVVKACKKHFLSEEVWTEFYSAWGMVLNYIAIPTYKTALREFEPKFVSILVEYYISTWLENWKEKVVQAWVDQRPHLDNTATSRIEGCHAKIKEYLDSPTRDLKLVYESLELYWTKQHADYKVRLESAKTQKLI